jgi:hypothetical protein
MRLGNRASGRFGRLSLGILLASWPAFSFASFNDDLQIQIFKYASDTHSVFSLTNTADFTSESFLSRTNIFVEGGPQGAWSFDPDPVRFNFKLNSKGSDFIWLGREQPLNLVRAEQVEFTSALGSIWAQNQLDALNPRVSGWIGTGFVKSLDEKSNWKIFGAYSPVFLPSFGPSLGFTDRGELNPSRFARLPPGMVITNGVTVPIRYRLQMDQLSQLVFQQQAMVGLSSDSEDFNFDVYGFTAPHPDPVARTDSKLAVGEDAVNARVDVNPQFPRESWAGARLQSKKMAFQPAVELLQKLNELSVHVASVTGYFDTVQLNPFVLKRASKASFGLVSHFQKMFEAPAQSDFLVFLKFPVDLTDNLILRTLVQSTLLNGKTSFYWMNELEYAVTRTFSITGAIRILTGEDNSYFGDWRNQDSFSGGLKWDW